MRGRDWAMVLGALGAGYWLTRRLYREATRFNFLGKTVLISGGSRGLGLVMARQLVEEGAQVAICARDEMELERAERDLVDHGAESPLALPCDITDDYQVQETVRRVQDWLGPIDVLINNAGTIAMGPLDSMTLDDFHRAMSNNFWGAVHMTLAVLPEMRERHSGRIVNISSVGGKIAMPHLIPYSVSKFALTGFSEGLRKELARDGITVTTICPGLMRTGSHRNAYFKGQYQAEFFWFTLLDSLWATSTSAEAAARRILNACSYGEAEVVLTLPAKAAVLLHGLCPGLIDDLFGLVNELMLPGPGGIGTGMATGAESRSEWTPEWLTEWTDEAARENNEIEPEPIGA